MIYVEKTCMAETSHFDDSLIKTNRLFPSSPEKRELSYTCTIDKAKFSQLSHIKPIFDVYMCIIYICVERERETLHLQ